MNKLTASILSAFLFSALFFSCVPNKKYQESLAKNSTLAQEKRSCEKKFEGSQNENKRLLDDLRKSEQKATELAKDTSLMGERYRSIHSLNREVERLYRQLLGQNEALIANSSSEKRELVETLATLQAEVNQKNIQLSKKEAEIEELRNSLTVKSENNESLQGDLSIREARVRELQAELSERESNMAQLQADLEAREARVNELEAAIAGQEAQAKALKEKLSTALLNFSTSDLTVEQRNGKVYVSLSQDLLFATGSKVLDLKGKNAIQSLAQVLNNNPDIEIMIEGHTDSVGEANANWDLSVLRATTIVKELLKNGVLPERITASGKGEHAPVATNVNESGRAKNRRTEVILTPKLDELFEILKN